MSKSLHTSLLEQLIYQTLKDSELVSSVSMEPAYNEYDEEYTAMPVVMSNGKSIKFGCVEEFDGIFLEYEFEEEYDAFELTSHEDVVDEVRNILVRLSS